MIMNWEPTLGGGTSKTLDVPEEVQDPRQRLNFVGHPELTRFLSFCALKETYADDDEVLPAALRHIVTDFQSAMSDGILVDYGGEKICIRLACLVTKGDWPWLIEAGHLCRHFRRAAKREHAVNPNAGLCHTSALLARKASLAETLVMTQLGCDLWGQQLLSLPGRPKAHCCLA